VEQRQELVFYDRYEQQLKPEKIYGEKPLRWAYQTTIGRFCLNAVIKRRWFSGLYGRWADCPCSAREIAPFIERFELDPDEFLDSPETLRTFNEFFHRALKPGARPIASEPKLASFPADGRHLLIENLDNEQIIYAKGQALDLPSLTGDEGLARELEGGTAVISRLCPSDYHRFHFPLSGVPGEPRLINGSLFSVNPIALARDLNYLWQNKRQLTLVSDSPAGSYLFLEIGATNVGSIINTAEPGSPVTKGDEKGYFRFGGSMVMTFFKKGQFDAAPDLKENSANGVELYARMGDTMGSILS
tara:strand:- start:8962 stop:9867 length:906 start_codon:yes stop_codon:yes gene_type:complete